MARPGRATPISSTLHHGCAVRASGVAGITFSNECKRQPVSHGIGALASRTFMMLYAASTSSCVWNVTQLPRESTLTCKENTMGTESNNCS